MIHTHSPEPTWEGERETEGRVEREEEMRKGGEKGKRKEKYWVKHREKIEKFQGHLILYTRVRVRTLTHSPTHSITHYPLTHHPLTHSLTHSITHYPLTHYPLTHSPTHSITHYPLTHHPLTTHSPTHPPTHSITHSLLTHPPTHSLTHPLTHSLLTHLVLTHPPTHLSVFKNKQPGVVLSPWRETHVVHLISILTHTKIEPCRRTEKLKPKVSSQAIKLTAPDAKRGGESKVRKVHLDRQGQEVYKLAYSPHLASPQLLSHTHTVHKNGQLE